MEVSILTITVKGEIDSLEDTIVDFNTYVGLCVEYSDPHGSTLIQYCLREELTKFYKETLALNNPRMYHVEKLDDGNWANSYSNLCESTTELLTGMGENWCMDLARFYSDMLYYEPKEVLHTMFNRGLTIDEALCGDTWSDAEINGKEVFTQINNYDEDVPFVYDLVCYGYIDNNKDNALDFSDSIYFAKVKEDLIKSVYDEWCENKYTKDIPNINIGETPEWKKDTEKLVHDVIMVAFSNGFTGDVDDIWNDMWFDYTTTGGVQLNVHIHKPNLTYIMEVCTEKHERGNRVVYSKVEHKSTLGNDYITSKYTEYLELLESKVNTEPNPFEDLDVIPSTQDIPTELYDKLNIIGLIPNEINVGNVGKSDYYKHLIQPWVIFNDHTHLNYQECDIIKRILRSKEGERMLDLEKCKHILDELIRQEKLKE